MRLIIVDEFKRADTVGGHRDPLSDLLIEGDQFRDAVAQLSTELTCLCFGGRDLLCTGAIGREREVLAHSETTCFSCVDNGKHSPLRCLEFTCGRVADGGCDV